MRDKMIMNGEFEANIILPITEEEWETMKRSLNSELSPFGENLEYGDSN